MIDGDTISRTVYESAEERNYKFTLRCDLSLLKKLAEPTTVYDVITKLNYPHSTAYNRLQEYLQQGVIEKVKSEHLESGLTKKYYQLTTLGSELLEILEKMVENMSTRQ